MQRALLAGEGVERQNSRNRMQGGRVKGLAVARLWPAVLRSAVVRFQGLAFDSIAKISDALVGYKGSRGTKSTQVWLRPSTTGRAFASTPKLVPMAADLAAIPGDGRDSSAESRASISH